MNWFEINDCANIIIIVQTINKCLYNLFLHLWNTSPHLNKKSPIYNIRLQEKLSSFLKDLRKNRWGAGDARKMFWNHMHRRLQVLWIAIFFWTCFNVIIWKTKKKTITSDLTSAFFVRWPVNPYLPPRRNAIKLFVPKTKICDSQVSHECMSDTVWSHTAQFVSIHRLKIFTIEITFQN